MSKVPYPLLDANDPGQVEDIVRALGWLKPEEKLEHASRAGEGNMNLVLRLKTNHRSLVLKQSRPWVEKYPSIPAPSDRALVEIEFYRAVSAQPDVASGMPRLLRYSAEMRCMLLEDLGEARDFSDMYSTRMLGDREAEWLGAWLSALHRLVSTSQVGPRVVNREMRALNHAHLFVIPMQETGGADLDSITAGLEAAALMYRRNEALARRLKMLGDLYLKDGTWLLHGDYYPGSWVQGEDGPRVIDPEFCLPGPREYDLGVMYGHFRLAGVPERTWQVVRQSYGEPADIDQNLVTGFAGMEIIRRLIGVAQLPLERTLPEKQELLGEARSLLLDR